MTESLHMLSGAYAVDALDDDERALFEKHLPGCRDCQEEVASLREAATLMADAVAVTPPASLRANVLAGISTVRPLPPETGRGPAPAATAATKTDNVVPMRRRTHRVGRLLAAAAAVLVVAGGAVWQPWHDDTSSTTLSAADQVLAASDAKHYSIDFSDGSSATVVRSANEGRAVLLTQDMAAPPSGKAYELWLRDKSGEMTPAGMMLSAGDHKVLLKGDASKATGVGITVEPEKGSDQPTSQPIAMFELSRADA